MLPDARDVELGESDDDAASPSAAATSEFDASLGRPGEEGGCPALVTPRGQRGEDAANASDVQLIPLMGPSPAALYAETLTM